MYFKYNLWVPYTFQFVVGRKDKEYSCPYSSSGFEKLCPDGDIKTPEMYNSIVDIKMPFKG